MAERSKAAVWKRVSGHSASQTKFSKSSWRSMAWPDFDLHLISRFFISVGRSLVTK